MQSMMSVVLPDSVQVSREAAERHAILTAARKEREQAPRSRFLIWRPLPH